MYEFPVKKEQNPPPPGGGRGGYHGRKIKVVGSRASRSAVFRENSKWWTNEEGHCKTLKKEGRAFRNIGKIYIIIYICLDL